MTVFFRKCLGGVFFCVLEEVDWLIFKMFINFVAGVCVCVCLYQYL